MADSRVHIGVEGRVRRVWMREHFEFAPRSMHVAPGGTFDADGMSPDSKIVRVISTSNARTAGGNLGIGKMQ